MLSKRKWGHYLTVLDRGAFKIKLLRFKPWHACSLQFHNHRSELWLFLSGSGVFSEGGHGTTYIQAGGWKLVKAMQHHRFLAHEKAVWVIEVQFGTKCVEEDIVRL